MSAKDKQRTAMNFLFTPEGFTPDISSLESEEEQQEAVKWIAEGGYAALYQFGLAGRPAEPTPSESFLYQVADTFFKQLTDLPELELVRQKAKVTLGEETAEELLWAVPFVIGAE